jgi:hypothetical protein
LSPDCFCKFFEFVIPIKEDPLGSKCPSEKFSQYLAGWERASVHLREASCGFCRWPVEVMFDEEGRMLLHTGWEKFARAHNLEVGWLANYKWEGDDELGVKVFDGTSYGRHYHNDNNNDGSDEDKR